MHNTEDSWSHSMKQKRDWTSHNNGIYIYIYKGVPENHPYKKSRMIQWMMASFLLIISLKNVNKKQWRKKKAEFSVNTRQNVQKHRNAEDNIIIKKKLRLTTKQQQNPDHRICSMLFLKKTCILIKCYLHASWTPFII